jgi:hypothetical protein
VSLILKQPITGPAAWHGADLAGDTTWLHPLSRESVAEIDAALAHVKAQGLRFPHFGKEDFPLKALEPELQRWADELENGRGLLALRGLPVERYSDEDINTVADSKVKCNTCKPRKVSRCKHHPGTTNNSSPKTV